MGDGKTIGGSDAARLGAVVKRFRFAALFEALTWLGLLVGMGFKYLPDDGNEIGVKIFGPLHGAAFLLYVPIAAWTIFRLRWGFFTAVAAIVASLPPFGTLIFEKWVARTGRLAGPPRPS